MREKDFGLSFLEARSRFTCILSKCFRSLICIQTSNSTLKELGDIVA